MDQNFEKEGETKETYRLWNSST